MAEVVKMLSNIDLSSKYSWVISNTDINVAENLGLIGIKTY